MAVLEKTKAECRTANSLYMSIAVISTTNEVLTDSLSAYLKGCLSRGYDRLSYEITKESSTQIGVLVHDKPEALDELLIKTIFEDFSNSQVRNLPSGTMGNIEYKSLTGYVKSPFKRTLPQKKNHLLHIYKK